MGGYSGRSPRSVEGESVSSICVAGKELLFVNLVENRGDLHSASYRMRPALRSPAAKSGSCSTARTNALSQARAASSTKDSVNRLPIGLWPGELQRSPDEATKFLVVDRLRFPSRVGVVMEPISVFDDFINAKVTRRTVVDLSE